jgi:hypothetical protein
MKVDMVNRACEGFGAASLVWMAPAPYLRWDCASVARRRGGKRSVGRVALKSVQRQRHAPGWSDGQLLEYPGQRLPAR